MFKRCFLDNTLFVFPHFAQVYLRNRISYRSAVKCFVKKKKSAFRSYAKLKIEICPQVVPFHKYCHICHFIVLALLWPLCASYIDLHAFISVTGCLLYAMPSQITLEAIPVDVLCEIWEVLDNVEHLTCERVSDPHKVCHNCVVYDS